MARDKHIFESEVKKLIGKTLHSVRYFEIRYSNGQPNYIWPGFSGHSLDFGCDLVMSDGSVYGFTWDGEYFQYGITALEKSISETLTDYAEWDMKNDSNWSDFFGLQIRNAVVHWSSAGYQNEKLNCYPQDISITFNNNNSIHLSASQYLKNTDELFGISDNITVIFGDTLAEKYRVSQFAQENG